MKKYIVRPEVRDSLEIAKLIKDAWNSAYKGIISNEFLQNMDIEKISEQWKKNIEIQQDVYIYKEKEEILGVVRFGKAEEAVSKKTGEIFCLYVKTNEKRKGIGTQLFEFAKNKLIHAGYEKMLIWCLKGNTQGENFYKKHGGEQIKERDYVVRGIEVREEGFLYDLKAQ